MAFQILPLWRDPSGAETSPIAITCHDMGAVQQEVAEWLRSHGGRPDMRVVVTDDVTWRKVVTVRLRKGVR